MKCENCNKREAVFHYQRTQNGKTTEAHLCRECAERMGYRSQLESEIFFPFLFESSPRAHALQRCPQCHTALDEIRATGKFSCASCYDAFRDRLDLTPFVGKGYPAAAPVAAGNCESAALAEKEKKKEKKEKSLDELKKALAEAVAAEQYEKAAELRDAIRAREV